MVIVTGKECGGKTECIRVAHAVERSLGAPVNLTVVAANSVHEEQLFGYQVPGKK